MPLFPDKNMPLAGQWLVVFALAIVTENFLQTGGVCFFFVN